MWTLAVRLILLYVRYSYSSSSVAVTSFCSKNRQLYVLLLSVLSFSQHVISEVARLIVTKLIGDQILDYKHNSLVSVQAEPERQKKTRWK